jgi:CspA family cold shock protein
MIEGIIKFYNPQKGYGFIQRPGEADLFVHYSGLIDKGAYPPQPGQRVSFDIGHSRRGPKAVGVRPVPADRAVDLPPQLDSGR